MNDLDPQIGDGTGLWAAPVIGGTEHPVTARTGRRPVLSGEVHYTLLSTATIVILLGLWALATNLFHIPAMVLPSPQSILHHFRTMLLEGYAGHPLWEHILVSVLRTLTGFLIGVTLAIPLGLWMGYSRRVNAILWPVFGFIRPIPPIAYIPLAILWFGSASSPRCC